MIIRYDHNVTLITENIEHLMSQKDHVVYWHYKIYLDDAYEIFVRRNPIIRRAESRIPHDELMVYIRQYNQLHRDLFRKVSQLETHGYDSLESHKICVMNAINAYNRLRAFFTYYSVDVRKVAAEIPLPADKEYLPFSERDLRKLKDFERRLKRMFDYSPYRPDINYVLTKNPVLRKRYISQYRKTLSKLSAFGNSHAAFEREFEKLERFSL